MDLHPHLPAVALVPSANHQRLLLWPAQRPCNANTCARTGAAAAAGKPWQTHVIHSDRMTARKCHMMGTQPQFLVHRRHHNRAVPRGRYADGPAGGGWRWRARRRRHHRNLQPRGASGIFARCAGSDQQGGLRLICSIRFPASHHDLAAAAATVAVACLHADTAAAACAAESVILPNLEDTQGVLRTFGLQ
jgi:hypothetical protein